MHFYKYEKTDRCDYWLPALIGGVAALGSAIVGGISQSNANKTNQSTANANLQLQKEQFDYQKALQQQVFQREDTAHQREVTDLKNAGINPLATATGGTGAGSGAIVNTEAPQNGYQEQAYTPDMNGFISAMNSIETSRLTENAQRMEQANFNKEIEQRKAELKSKENEAYSNRIIEIMKLQQAGVQGDENRKLEREKMDLQKQIDENNKQLRKSELDFEKQKYKDNEKMREAEEKNAWAELEKRENDNARDKERGTKSNETVRSEYTTAMATAAEIQKAAKETAQWKNEQAKKKKRHNKGKF